MNSELPTFLGQGSSRKRNSPPECSNVGTLRKGPLAEVRAGVRGDKGAWTPQELATAEEENGVAGAQWGLGLAGHRAGVPGTAPAGDERGGGWGRAGFLFAQPPISYRCLPLAQPRRTSTLEGNGVMEALEDRCSAGNRAQKGK